MGLPYTNRQFTRHFDVGSIQTIVHLGANDGSDWKELIEVYSPSLIVSFECNPKLIHMCEKESHEINKTHKNTKVIFIPKPVFSKRKIIEYWSVSCDDAGGLGSSSIYKHHNLPMEKMTMEATTIDEECKKLGIDSIDLICADIEGGEIEAFTNQSILNRTRYIMSEVGVDRNWKPGYPVLEDMEKMLSSSYGFEKKDFFWGAVGMAGEAFFANKNLVRI